MREQNLRRNDVVFGKLGFIHLRQTHLPYGSGGLEFMQGFRAGFPAKALNAFTNPLTNSYKRLVAGYEAPVYISWGRINCSALLRVPRAHGVESTRVELRCPDPSCNPYLAFAVMLDGYVKDRFDRVLGSAEAISARLEGTSRVTRAAFSAPVSNSNARA